VNSTDYSPPEQSILFHIALNSIEHGLASGTALIVKAAEYPPLLNEKRASFITLTQDTALRGCIGSLEPYVRLVDDVARNAFAAAFRDPRFPSLSESELDNLSIQISVLGPAEPLTAISEQALIRKLRPGIDGLVLKDKLARGTFLPAVWDSLPQPDMFLKQLKLKAGLPADYWSDTVEIERYTTESFSAPVSRIRNLKLRPLPVGRH